MRLLLPASLITLLACAACERNAGRAGEDTTVPAPSPPRSITGCYRSPTSVMGRTTALDGHASVAPGWLRFASAPGGDSGTVQLVDADGAAFQASWRRTSSDSIVMRGFDDFMQIVLRGALSDSTLTGSGLVTSDADVQRDASGRLEPLRREWAMRARLASCADLPAPAK